MTEVQMGAGVEALMARLIQTEQASLDTRQQVAAAPRAAAAPLVDTRTIGKAPTLTSEHKDWPKWSFQLTATVGRDGGEPDHSRSRGGQPSAVLCRGTGM